MGSNPVAVTSPSDFAPASSKEFLDIQATIECGFTLKRVRDMKKHTVNVVYLFHVIIPSNQIWQKIISQTNIFNIFPASVPFNSVSKILQANSHEKNCLTIDCGYINQNGPGRFRIHAENPEQQVCYFAKPNDDKFYNIFLSRHIKGENFQNKICFQIERIRSGDGSQTFSAKNTLENGTGRIGCSELQP